MQHLCLNAKLGIISEYLLISLLRYWLCKCYTAVRVKHVFYVYLNTYIAKSNLLKIKLHGWLGGLNINSDDSRLRRPSVLERNLNRVFVMEESYFCCLNIWELVIDVDDSAVEAESVDSKSYWGKDSIFYRVESSKFIRPSSIYIYLFSMHFFYKREFSLKKLVGSYYL